MERNLLIETLDWIDNLEQPDNKKVLEIGYLDDWAVEKHNGFVSKTIILDCQLNRWRSRLRLKLARREYLNAVINKTLSRVRIMKKLFCFKRWKKRLKDRCLTIRSNNRLNLIYKLKSMLRFWKLRSAIRIRYKAISFSLWIKFRNSRLLADKVSVLYNAIDFNSHNFLYQIDI